MRSLSNQPILIAQRLAESFLLLRFEKKHHALPGSVNMVPFRLK